MSVEAQEPIGPVDFAADERPQEPLQAAVKRKLSSPGATMLVIAITVLWTIPTFGLFVTSFRSATAAQSTNWMWAILWPPNWSHLDFTLHNYAEVITGGNIIPQGMGPYLINSFAISVPAAIFPLVIACMAAYALAWIPFRGSTFVFFAIFALQVVPLQMALLPLLRLTVLSQNWLHSVPGLENFDLTSTYIPLWTAHTMFALPLAIFLIHNFIAQLPRELMEAARVDGASHFLIFRKLVLPLAVPAIASFAIFQFLWVWNDYLVALTFAGGTPDVAPVTLYLANIQGTYGSALHLSTAGAFCAIIVPLIVFFSLQRFFVRGLVAGSVKG
jgi:alpha-glucoside transport system permease protein